MKLMLKTSENPYCEKVRKVAKRLLQTIINTELYSTVTSRNKSMCYKLLTFAVDSRLRMILFRVVVTFSTFMVIFNTARCNSSQRGCVSGGYDKCKTKKDFKVISELLREYVIYSAFFQALYRRRRLSTNVCQQ